MLLSVLALALTLVLPGCSGGMALDDTFDAELLPGRSAEQARSRQERLDAAREMLRREEAMAQTIATQGEEASREERRLLNELAALETAIASLRTEEAALKRRMAAAAADEKARQAQHSNQEQDAAAAARIQAEREELEREIKALKTLLSRAKLRNSG